MSVLTNSSLINASQSSRSSKRAKSPRDLMDGIFDSTLEANNWLANDKAGNVCLTP